MTHQSTQRDTAPSTNRMAIAIENIEHLRRLAGIDDEDLHEEIGRLKVGDLVRLTLLAHRCAAETVTIRITEVHRTRFSGKLAKPAIDVRLQRINNDMVLNFTADHIHSIQHAANGGSRAVLD